MKQLPLFSIIMVLFLASCGSNSSTPNPVDNLDSTKTPEPVQVQVPEKITFPSLDSLPVTANLYHSGDAAPSIVLCHQAYFNKYEYDSIAMVLHEKGYNCLATDQRSGGPIPMANGDTARNETLKVAIEKGKMPAVIKTDEEYMTGFVNAEQDIRAAIDFMKNKYGKPVILWGSSYSSTLALYAALESDNVRAVISFSPGDYFTDMGKYSLAEKLPELKKPMWVTSSLEEAPMLTEMLKKMELGENQIQFVPKKEGKHGSRALWMNHPDRGEYWDSLLDFLDKIK